MKKGLAFILCLIMTLSMLAACSNNNSANNSESEPSKTAPNSTASNEPQKKKTITYTLSTSDGKLTWDTPVYKKLTEATGVAFEYMTVLGGGEEGDKKYEVWLASGDYPDIVAVKPEMISKYRDGGALIPLEDLIDQYGPNIKKKFGKYYDLLRDPDGHIYSLYNINLAEEARADQQAEFVVRYDVLKDAGYPEVKTLDQLFEILKAYYAKNPKIDGQDVIPFSGAGEDLGYNNPANAASGNPDHGRFNIDTNNDVHFTPKADYTKQYYQFLNKLQNAGMLDKEFFTLNYESAGTKLAQGRILAGYYPQWVLDAPEKSLAAAGKPDLQYAKFPLHINDSVKDLSNAIIPTGSSNNWGITTKAKNPESVIKFIDYLFTDEGQKLIGWGIEGVHYEVQDGKRVRTQEVLDAIKDDPDYGYKEGIGSDYFAPQTTVDIKRFSFGPGAKLDDGDYATPLNSEFVSKNYDEATKEVLSQYGKQSWSEFMAAPERIPAFLWQLSVPEEAKIIMTNAENIWKKETPRIIMSKTADEFENNWNNYVSQLDKARVSELEQLWTDSWKAYVDIYNKAIQ